MARASVTTVFAACPFSFGYFASFYFLSVAAAYLWLSYFTPLEYDHAAARISAIASFAAFLVPATMITEATIRRRMLTQRQMDILAKVLLGVVVAVVVCSAVFGFKFAWPTNGEARSAISHPMWLNYLISICAATLVPFIFALFYQNSAWALMAASVAAGMALYPVSLNKTTFLAPYWLLALAGLIKFARARMAVMLTLLIPMLIGIVAFGLELPDKKPIFGLIKFRMLAIPGSGLDHYYHYFSTHPLTHFCQVSIVGRLFNCALPDQLGVIMANVYGLGSYNGSLFAAEGIASVGVWFAPLTALVCGFIIAAGNIASSGLRPDFVFLSSAILVQILMNVPLSVIMVTHGGLLMFLLWFVCRRSRDFGS